MLNVFCLVVRNTAIPALVAAMSSAIHYFQRLCGFASVEGLNGEGNGSPLQYSCLENPMDGGAW